MKNTSDYLKRAIDLLQCPNCGGNFGVSREEEIRCSACASRARIEQGNIFCFEKSELSENVMEKTLYGPESRELRQELAAGSGARLDFLKYLPERTEDLTALDYGCGSSRQVFDLANHSRNGIIFGVDYDIVPLQIIAQTAGKLGYRNIFLLQYRSKKLPFRDNIFEVVTSHQVLEHVSHPEESVREIHRVLKERGVFDVDFPNGNSIGEISRRLFHKMTGTKNPHISAISLKRARGMFRRAGLRMERFQSVQTLTGPLMYFLEGFIFRFLMKKNKLWKVRKTYQNNFFFRGLEWMELRLAKRCPRTGHAFEFTLSKNIRET